MQPVSAKRIVWYRRQWFKVAAMIFTVLIAAATIISLTLFALWQSRPEKALLETAKYALQTPATYYMSSSGTDLSIGVDGQRYSADGTFENIPISSVFSDNTLYVKSPQPEKLYDAYFAYTVPEMFKSTVRSAVMDLKDHWISIDLYKIAPSTGSVSTAKCGLDTLSRLKQADIPTAQIGFQYAAHPFLDVKVLDTTPIETSYQLTLNQSKLTSFYQQLTTLNAFKNLSCSTSSNPFINAQIAGSTIALTTTRPDHHLRELSIRDSSGETTKVKADYAKVPSITIPTNVTTYDQIASSLMRSFLSTFIGSR